jgi:type I restriction enzyme S subunit
MSLKSYPQYKESGVDGSEHIPCEWNSIRNKYFLKERNNPSQDGTEELLTVSQYTGITKRKDRLTEESDLLTTAKTLEGYKTVHKEDMVMNIMLAWNGSLGVSPFNGIVSPAYCVFNVNKKLIVPKYLHYLHRTKLYTGIFEAASTGVIKSRLRLYPDKYLALKSIIPPLLEQEQIALYLDWMTSQINRFIKAKKRQIELLKEQKQVIISNVVTGKIDVRTEKPYPKYKDSGAEWVEIIPEEWDVKRLKDCTTIVLGKMLKSTPEPGYVLKPYLRSTNIQWIKPDICDVSKMYFSKNEMNTFKLQNNDILVCEGGEAGRCCIWKNDLDECYIQNSVHKVTCNDEILPDFLLFQFQSFVKIGYIKSVVNRVSIAHLTREKLVKIPLAIPCIEIQKRIVGFIYEKICTIDSIIDRIERQISKLEEYRCRLISDIVTGKIDVRDNRIPEFEIDNEVDGIENIPEAAEEIEEGIVANE